MELLVKCGGCGKELTTRVVLVGHRTYRGVTGSEIEIEAAPCASCLEEERKRGRQEAAE